MTDNQSVITVTLGARFNGTTQRESISLPMAEIEARPALRAALLKAGIYAIAASMKNDAGAESPAKFAQWVATIDASTLAAAVSKEPTANNNYLQADRVADARAIVNSIPSLAANGVLLMLPGVDFPSMVLNKNLPALAARDNSAVLENWNNLDINQCPDTFPSSAFKRMKDMLAGFQSLQK